MGTPGLTRKKWEKSIKFSIDSHDVSVSRFEKYGTYAKELFTSLNGLTNYFETKLNFSNLFWFFFTIYLEIIFSDAVSISSDDKTQL